MKRRSRISKYVATALCALVLAAAMTTLKWQGITFNRCGSLWTTGLSRGAFYVERAHLTGGFCIHGFDVEALELVGECASPLCVDSEYASWEEAFSDCLRVGLRPKYASDQVSTRATIPLWIPLALFGAPTALLWWQDRRRAAPGRCRSCAYDLTGNVTGVCPECGTPAAR